jgi:hypothetical protein
MSEDLYSDVYDDDYTEDTGQQASGPKALREAYEKEKEARKALEDRLTAIEQESQAQKLATALEGKGVNPKAAKLALSQGVSPDKLDEWLGEWGDLFGVQAEQSSGSAVDESTQQQLQAVSGAPSGAPPANSGDAVAALGAIDNEQDFWSFIKSQQ